MNIDVKEQTATRSTITVSFDATEVGNKRKTIVREFCKQAKIPGFRPGKVPQSLVEKRFQKELKEELDRSLIRQAYDEGVQKSDLDVFSVVSVEEGEFEADQPGNVVFIVDLNPSFDLPDYKGIKIESDSNEVSENEIDDAVEMLRRERAEFNKVEKPAGVGDYVKCSYEGKVGRKKIEEIAPDQSILGTQKNTWEEAGSEDAPGVASIIQALVGMKAGDSQKVEHTFADDHAVEALRGKKGVYQLEVHEVREKILPEIDEEFLKSLNAESEEDLRKRFCESLESRKQQENYGKQRQSVGDYLREAIDLEVPQSAFDREKESIMEDFARHNMQQGLSKEQMDEEITKNLDQIEKTAKERVKLDLIIDRIAQEEKIEIGQEDLSQLLYSQSMQTGIPIEQLVKELKNDQDRLNSLRQSALFNKTLQFLVDSAEVTVLES